MIWCQFALPQELLPVTIDISYLHHPQGERRSVHIVPVEYTGSAKWMQSMQSECKWHKNPKLNMKMDKIIWVIIKICDDYSLE